ncbi:MAG TPA: hypothetical protein VFD73_15620, partial [Gemmatimonadales bacterium]|nr:hypothetical protein [Gemmatimonadales bacterium]
GTKRQILDFPGFARWQGTSFAAATVSGAVAAKIGPDCDAQGALQAVLDSQNGMHAGIKRFSLSPVTAASSAT